MGLISFGAENTSKMPSCDDYSQTKSLDNNNIVSWLTFYKKGDVKAKMMLSRDEDKK